MTQTRLYRIHTEDKTLQNVKEIDFSDHSLKERYDIQEWVESTPQILGEELLIIAKEKTFFNGTNERPDLIAIDKEGNVVVIELKRDDSGSDVHWQSIKYASYWSRFEISHILDVYSDYLKKYFPNEVSNDSEDYASERILDFIEKDTLDSLNKKQRIIMVSHRFAKEAISATKWLIDEYNVDVKCVQLIPYYDSDMNIYNLFSNTLLPLPGIDELLINPASKDEFYKSQSGRVRKDDDITGFFEKLKSELANERKLKYVPDKTSRWAGVGNGFRYYHFWFKEGLWDNWNMSYKVWRYEAHDVEELDNSHALYFDLDRKKLLSNGMTEKMLNGIINEMKAIELPGFEFEDEEATVYLQKVYDGNHLDDDMLKAIKQDLISLINYMNPRIENIFEEMAF